MADAPSTALEKLAPRELLDPRGVSAQSPETPAPLATRPQAKVAGGIPAIISSMKHAFGEAGVVRGARLLARLNQFDGYDCPRFARPGPDGPRRTVQVFANGAQANAGQC